jgi:hypothetical protein
MIERKELTRWEFFKSRKLKGSLLEIAACILLVLYSSFVGDWGETKITDAQVTKVDGRYVIATEYRSFVNFDA